MPFPNPCPLDVPIIETERLKLRGHTIEDASNVIALWSNAEVTRSSEENRIQQKNPERWDVSFNVRRSRPRSRQSKKARKGVVRIGFFQS